MLRTVALAALTLTALSGCVALGITDHRPTTAPADATAAAPAPEPTATLLAVPDGTVLATGTFSGHGVTGTAEVIADGHYLHLELSDVVVPDGRPYAVTLLSEPPVDAECSGAYWSYPFGSPDDPAHVVDAAYAPEFFDPSFLAGVQLQPAYADSRGDYPDCAAGVGGYPIMAYAPLSWTGPDRRPDLHPVDSGPRSGATGAVRDGTTGANEEYHPTGVYWIAAGDTYADIAARFGISVADLDYLNPVGSYTARHDDIEAGCTLNVRKPSRGTITHCPWDG